MTMRLLERIYFNTLFFSMNLGSLCAVAIFGLIPPLSKLGQFLFWPQNSFPSLHLHPHSPVGARITFLVLIAVVGASIQVLVTLPFAKPWSKSLVRVAAGIVAILAPMVGWLLVGPHGGIPTVLLGTATIASVFHAAYCVWKERTIRSWEIAMILVAYFGLWTYLYHSKIDPVMLAVPVLACLSYLMWAFTVSASGQRQAPRQSSNV